MLLKREEWSLEGHKNGMAVYLSTSVSGPYLMVILKLLAMGWQEDMAVKKSRYEEVENYGGFGA